MMKIKTALASVALAAAVFAPLAQAADVSQATQTITLATGNNVYTHSFAAGSANDTFTDRYNFSAAAGSTLSALVSTFNLPDLGGIDFTNFSVYNSAGFSIVGTQLTDKPVETWSAYAKPLAADNYYLLVSGKVLNNVATSYVGTLSVIAPQSTPVTPVPEPETYAMLLAGLGLVGAIARRRKV